LLDLIEAILAVSELPPVALPVPARPLIVRGRHAGGAQYRPRAVQGRNAVADSRLIAGVLEDDGRRLRGFSFEPHMRPAIARLPAVMKRRFTQLYPGASMEVVNRGIIMKNMAPAANGSGNYLRVRSHSSFRTWPTADPFENVFGLRRYLMQLGHYEGRG
jgi:hypothetical protein